MSQGENWVTHKLDVWCSKTTNMTIILKEETMGIEFLTRSAAWECDLRMRFWSVNERTGTHIKEQHGCKWIGLLWLWVQKNTLIHRTKYAPVKGYRWQGHPNIPKWPKHTRRSYNLQSFADTLMEHVVMEWLFRFESWGPHCHILSSWPWLSIETTWSWWCLGIQSPLERRSQSGALGWLGTMWIEHPPSET